MSEENEKQKNQQKQEEQDASKKALKTGAKAAANAYAGPIGGKAVDLASKTKLGDAALNAGAKSLNRNPAFGKIANAANKSGALDAADKAVDATSGGNGKSSSNTTSSILNSSSKSSSTKIKSPFNSNNNSESGGEVEEDISAGQNYSDKIFAFILEKKFIFIYIFGGFLLVVFLIAAIIAIIGGPVSVISDFFSGIFDTIMGFFSNDQEEQMNDYYETLKETQTEINSKYGICIDVNLITAALTVNIPVDQFLNDSQDNVVDGEDNPNYDPNSENEDAKATIDVSYKKMKKQVKLLANMQMMTNHYELDSNGSYCANNMEPSVITEGSKNSSTFELIASHDINGIQAFFTKKSNEERNYAYYIYHPPFASDGTCTYSYAKSLLPSEKKELSIGDLAKKEDSVFYWNLVNSFIPDYYSEYLPNENNPTYLEKVKKIAEDIYLLYNEIGPSKACSFNARYICRSDEGADFYGGTRENFIKNTSPIVIDEMTRTGVFSSITLAQAILESSGGSSGLSSKYSNYYGMTAGGCAPSNSPSTLPGTVYQSGEGGNSCTGNVFWNGSVVALCNASGEDCQWYRIYDSFKNSTMDHSRLLSEGYACNIGSTYQEQLDCIVNHGYATDPNYKNKILEVINDYNLTDYDIGTWSGAIDPINEKQFADNLCYSDDNIVAGDFTNWKQYDPTWANVRLGTSTVGKIGCAMTSVCIQIMRSGVSTSLGKDFNPGTFAQKMTSIGGFDSKGNIYWAKPSNIAPGFIFVNSVRQRANPTDIANLVNQGYFVILNVKNGRHWVAVDKVVGNKIYMFDPGSKGIEVGETYGLNSIVGYVYYRRG